MIWFMDERNKECIKIFWKAEGMRQIKRPRRKWEDNIKILFRELDLEDGKIIGLV
jgi:hypothetical protein